MLIEAKALTDYINSQLNTWQSLLPSANINPGSMIYMDADVIAEVLYLAQLDAVTLANNSFLAYATDDELTNLGLDRGIPRISASTASGTVTFSRQALASADYPIPLGTIISTQPDGSGTTIAFQTTAAATLYGQILAPTSPAAAIQTSGGVLSSGTYSYKISALGGDGKETDTVSVSKTISSGSTNAIQLTWVASARASGYNIYVSVAGIYKLLAANVSTASYLDLVGTSTSSTIAPTVNSTGNLSVDVAVTASSAGAFGNVAANTVTNFISKPTGLDSVANQAAMTGGVDTEDDDTYRARIKSQLSANSGVGTVAGYQATCEAVAGVASATVSNTNTGGMRNQFTIYITANTGTGVPSAALISAVQAVVTSDENRAVCDNITVAAPTPVSVNITASFASGAWDNVSYTSAQLTSTITSALQTLFRNVSIGGTLYKNDIANVIHDTPGIKDFTLSAPASNTTLTSSQMAIPGTITLTFS